MRPASLHVGSVLFWVIRTYNASGALVDADSTPSASVRKNGSSVGDSVTIVKRSATVGIYDAQYDPGGEVEGDRFTIEETATIDGATFSHSWAFTVLALERGTNDAAALVLAAMNASPPNVNALTIAANAIGASQIASGALTSAKFAAGAITSGKFADDSITSFAISNDAAAKIASYVPVFDEVESVLSSYGVGLVSKQDEIIAAIGSIDVDTAAIAIAVLAAANVAPIAANVVAWEGLPIGIPATQSQVETVVNSARDVILGSLGDSGATPEEVWSYFVAATGDAAAAKIADQATPVSGAEIAEDVATRLAMSAVRELLGEGLLASDRIVIRGTTWRISLPFSLPVGWDRVEFTARSSSSSKQSASIVWIRESNPSAIADGLQVLAGKPADDAGDGSIVTAGVDSPIVLVQATATQLVDPAAYAWDAKLFVDGEVTQTARGTLFVEADVTRSAE